MANKTDPLEGLNEALSKLKSVTGILSEGMEKLPEDQKKALEDEIAKKVTPEVSKLNKDISKIFNGGSTRSGKDK